MFKLPNILSLKLYDIVLVNDCLNGYINKDISTTIENQKFANGIVSNVRINCKFTLITTNFLKENCFMHFKMFRPKNAFLVIEYNYRLEKSSYVPKGKDNDKYIKGRFSRCKINMPIITFKNVNKDFLIKNHNSSEPFNIDRVIKNLISKELNNYNHDGSWPKSR